MTEKKNKFPKANLYLVGFMGSGKSTMGRQIASRLKFSFFDSDTEIERRRGRSVTEIFEREGEEAFRRYERQFIEEGHPPVESVVACGGGLVVQEGMLDLLKKKGVVVCLYATPETVLSRVRVNRNRPLLEVEEPMKKIRELMTQRQGVYGRAGTMILTDNRAMCEILAHIHRVYLREARSFEKSYTLEGENDECRTGRVQEKPPSTRV